MDKRQFSEKDISTKLITPAKENAGWDRMHPYFGIFQSELLKLKKIIIVWVQECNKV